MCVFSGEADSSNLIVYYDTSEDQIHGLPHLSQLIFHIQRNAALMMPVTKLPKVPRGIETGLSRYRFNPVM